MNAFEVLGLSQDADQTQVRTAYRAKVKTCHPDRFLNPDDQSVAQEKLIQLNLAYEEALRLSAQKQVGFHTVNASDAKKFAEKLLDQGNYESALRQLARADRKDDEWFYIQGQILLGMRQYENAHASFREAVRRNPNNNQYRQGALNAALEMKKHQKLTYRVADWAHDLFSPRKRVH